MCGNQSFELASACRSCMHCAIKLQTPQKPRELGLEPKPKQSFTRYSNHSKPFHPYLQNTELLSEHTPGISPKQMLYRPPNYPFQKPSQTVPQAFEVRCRTMRNLALVEEVRPPPTAVALSSGLSCGFSSSTSSSSSSNSSSNSRVVVAVAAVVVVVALVLVLVRVVLVVLVVLVVVAVLLQHQQQE